MKKLIIFGKTSMACIIAEYIKECSAAEIVAFTVDSPYLDDKTELEGVPLVPFETIQNKFSPEKYELLIVMSSVSKVPHLKHQKMEEAKRKGYTLFSFIHPSSFIAKSVKLGENTIICPQVVIEPRVIIGNGVFIRSAAYISHETIIGDYTYIAPRVAFSGLIKVGKHCFIGTNATIRDKVEIGDDALIGAGAVILKNVKEKAVVKAVEGTILPVDRFKINA